MLNRTLAAGWMVGLAWSVSSQAGIANPLNNDFQSQDIVGFGPSATVDHWTATGNTGLVDGNGGVNYPGDPSEQWGVIFGSGAAPGGVFEQGIGTVDAGLTQYRLTFDQTQNASGGAISINVHVAIVEIIVDGNVVATYDALPGIPAQGAGISEEIFDFTLDTADVDVDAGDAVVLRFAGTMTGILNTPPRGQWLIDNVEITIVPEPGSLALLGLGGLGMFRRRRD